MANTVDISAVQDDVRNATNLWTTEALSFLQTLKSNAAEIVSVDLPDVDTSLPSTPYDTTLFSRIGSEPTIGIGSAFVAPASDPGGTASSTLVSLPALVAIPNDTTSSPTLTLPARPELTIPDAPTSPLIDDVTTPVAPTIELPTAPSLANVVFPDAPTLSLPTFSEAAPDAPSSFLQSRQFEYSDAAFDETLINSVRGKLITDVVDGGYGIEPDDEDALWARMRDREAGQLASEEGDAEEAYANRGFSIPPGALLAAKARARTEAEERLSEANREISVTRAGLFRDARQFAMTQGVQTEQIRWQNFGFAMERALNAARFSAEFSVLVHDAQIRQFNAALQRYVSIAEVARTQLQVALTQVQIYEAEVRAAVARQEATRIDVDLYRALIDASNSRVNLFESQVRAASLTAELQRLKVDTFRSEVQAYATRVQANESQLRTYEVGIRGELAKVEIFRTEVAAYTDRVRAAGVEQSARNERAQVAIAAKQAEIADYRARVDRYQTQVTAEIARVRSILDRYTADSDVYRSAMAGYESLTRVSIEEETAQIRAIEEQTKRLQTNAQLSLEAASQTLQTRFNAANAGSQITTGLVSAAASTLQAIIVEEESQAT